MTPEQVAASYDRIADRWLDVSTYGFAQIERAVAFVKNKGVALDVGCGTGRVMGLLGKHGFRTDGLDVSPAMLALARERHPEARLFQADICRWELPRSYDLIVAWDSVWHVPLAQQKAVLAKLCRGLAAGGVLVFTTGGMDSPDEKEDLCMGPPMYHATLGVPKTLQVLAEAGCVCCHLEYDQPPELHVYIVAQKAKDDRPTTSGLIRLRNVERDDLPRLYEMQLDPELNRLAGTIPRSAEAFEAHWANVLRNPSVTAKAILLGEALVGTVSCFWRDGQANVGYWVSREHWGMGIASRALELLLHEVATRPLYASAATNNTASLRVLQKCGFVVEQVQLSPATDRFSEREVALLMLTEGAPVGAEKTRGSAMIPLHRDPHFTFRFAADRIIPCFHLEGVGAGRRVSVFKIDPASGERVNLIATARVGDGGWVDLPEPIIVWAGQGFVAVPEEDDP